MHTAAAVISRDMFVSESLPFMLQQAPYHPEFQQIYVGGFAYYLPLLFPIMVSVGLIIIAPPVGAFVYIQASTDLCIVCSPVSGYS